MNINTNLSKFIKKHKNKNNQVIFHKADCKKNKVIENIINNFLSQKNSFIFESVEKGKNNHLYRRVFLWKCVEVIVTDLL